jgi:hypothetical protein
MRFQDISRSQVLNEFFFVKYHLKIEEFREFFRADLRRLGRLTRVDFKVKQINKGKKLNF